MTLAYMYGYGYGMGSNWLILVGIPLIIGLIAQFRVSSAFKKWGAVRASANVTGAEAAREILAAAKIILQQMGIVQPGEEVLGVNKVLNAAALTYVAAFVATLGNLLYLLTVRDRR